MSFASDIKKKLCMTPPECPMCPAAELSAIVRFAGGASKTGFKITTENPDAAIRIRQDLAAGFGLRIEPDHSKAYKFTIEDTKTLENMHLRLMPEENGGSTDELMPFECCSRAFIRGAFLGGGSVNDPERGYHMEFDAHNSEDANLLRSELSKLGFGSRITRRKESFVVYIKDCETIAQVLGAMGAGAGALALYNTQIEKDVRNRVNRTVNCETANIKKTTAAYIKHMAAIKKIKEAGAFDELPIGLREAARLRMEYPDDSLKELGEKFTPKIGKSGVNHRMEKLIEFAEEL